LSGRTFNGNIGSHNNKIKQWVSLFAATGSTNNTGSDCYRSGEKKSKMGYCMNTFTRDLLLPSLPPTLEFPVQCGTRMGQAESEAGQDCCGPCHPRYQQKSH